MQAFEFISTSIRDRAPWFVFILLSSIITFSYTTQDFITAIGLILLTAYILKPSIKRHTLKRYALTPYVLFALIWLVVVTAMSQVAFKALASCVALCTIPITYIVACEYKRFDELWRYMKIFFLILAGTFSIWGIYQVGHQVGKGLTEGPYYDRNTFASLINALWFLTAWQFFTLPQYLKSKDAFQKNALETSMLVLFFFVSLCLFMTSSRGAMIAWALLSPIMLWASYQYTHNKRLLLSAIAVIIVAYFASDFVFQANVSDRTFVLTKDNSTSARLKLWISTMHMFLDYPIFGLGWGNFEYFYPQYRDISEKTTAGFYTHNDYLQLAAEGGVFALFIIGSLLLYVLLKIKQLVLALYQSKGQPITLKFSEKLLMPIHIYEVLALMLGVAAIMIHAGVNFIFYYIGVNAVLGLYLGRATRLTQNAKQISLPKLDSIRPSVKSLLWKFSVALILIPFIVHAILQFTFIGSQPVRKLLNAANIGINSIDIASISASVYPYNHYSQEFLMRLYEDSLLHVTSDQKNIKRKPMLVLAIRDFDQFRAHNANWANIGTREVRIILANLDLGGVRNRQLVNKAYQILAENIKSNPIHAESYALLARLQSIEGNLDKANLTLDQAAKFISNVPDLTLINLQYYRQNKQLTEADLLEVESLEAEMIHYRNLAGKGGYVGVKSKQSTEFRIKQLYKELAQLPNA